MTAHPLARAQRRTLVLLVLGYTGYYLCRSNFSVALPALADELAAGELSPAGARRRLGEIASLGVLLYAFGKFANGLLADRLGGRRAFLGGMAGSALCTLALAAGGGLPVFTLAWAANRAVQSAGWVGMVRMVSRWFPPTRYGAAMAVVSLSFLFGDAAVRFAMGLALDAGLSWRGLFGACGLTLAGLLAVASRWLREGPGEAGLPEPPGAASLYGDAGDPEEGREAATLGALWGPLLRSPAFLSACALSLGYTLLRETFNTWTPTFLVDGAGLGAGAAARASALFPLLGGVSVLATGPLSDRLGPRGRVWLLGGGLWAVAGCLAALSASEGPAATRVGLVALTGFAMIGPYSLLAGALSLDLGGKRGSASACGIIDGVGYLGGVLAGGGIAHLQGQIGWSGAFAALAVASALLSVSALPLAAPRAGAGAVAD